MQKNFSEYTVWKNYRVFSVKMALHAVTTERKNGLFKLLIILF